MPWDCTRCGDAPASGPTPSFAHQGQEGHLAGAAPPPAPVRSKVQTPDAAETSPLERPPTPCTGAPTHWRHWSDELNTFPSAMCTHSMRVCAQTCTYHTGEAHSGNHEKAVTCQLGQSWTHTSREKPGWGGGGRGPWGREPTDRAAGRDRGSAGGGPCRSKLLFTTQSPSVVIATQPPNHEMDITASRGGRAGGG